MINFTFGKRFKKWCIQLELIFWIGRERYNDNVVAGIQLAIPFPTLPLALLIKKLFPWVEIFFRE